MGVGGWVGQPWRLPTCATAYVNCSSWPASPSVCALKPTLLQLLLWRKPSAPRLQYFETMRGAARDGSATKQYYDFSLNSAKAAQAKLREFLALMPAEQREAAETQLASMPF